MRPRLQILNSRWLPIGVSRWPYLASNFPTSFSRVSTVVITYKKLVQKAGIVRPSEIRNITSCSLLVINGIFSPHFLTNQCASSLKYFTVQLLFQWHPIILFDGIFQNTISGSSIIHYFVDVASVDI